VPGGLLALSSNSGRFVRNEFAVVPEAQLTFGFHLTKRLDFTMGYSYLLWTNVVRAGDTIDRNVNPQLLPTSSSFGTGTGTPASPSTAVFHQTNMSSHFISAGMQLRF
jgi:hypothetical protein